MSMHPRGSFSRNARGLVTQENRPTLVNGRERKRTQVAVFPTFPSLHGRSSWLTDKLLVRAVQEEKDQVHWDKCGRLFQLQKSWNTCDPLRSDASEWLLDHAPLSELTALFRLARQRCSS